VEVEPLPADLVVTKTAATTTAQLGDEVDYTITIKNQGGPLFDGLLVDLFTNEAGEIIAEQTWPLESISRGEEIVVTYTLPIPDTLPTGVYTNTAQILGLHESRSARRQTEYESLPATHQLTVRGVNGMVLGTQATSCEPYLNSYLRLGFENSPTEVLKLQRFLSEYVDNTLLINGIFDARTEEAVRQFQQQYANEVLTPWGLQEPSGYVYYTTQKKINEIMCGAGIEFPLTIAQQEEIELTRTTTNRQNPIRTIVASIDNRQRVTPPPEPEIEEVSNVVRVVETAAAQTVEPSVTPQNTPFRDRLRSWLSPLWPF
jgi:peptidoglycan hydrolase-like protein with peptidoglycan-binding domain